MIRVIYPGFDKRASVKTAIDLGAELEFFPHRVIELPPLEVGEKVAFSSTYQIMGLEFKWKEINKLMAKKYDH
jgi:hypothetical protein